MFRILYRLIAMLDCYESVFWFRLLGWTALVLGIGFYAPSFVSLVAALLSIPWIIVAAVIVTRNAGMRAPSAPSSGGGGGCGRTI